MPQAEGLYTTLPEEDLLWERWESEYSVFSRLTGETHLLSELPAEAIRQLGRQPQTIQALATSLARECEVEPSAEWLAKIAGVVDNLVALELIKELP